MSDGDKARALLSKLSADGEREAAAIVARARDEAARLEGEAAARAARAVEDARTAHLALTAERESAARIEAKARARRSALGARQEMVDRVLEAARGMLAAAETPEWLARAVADSVAYLPDGAAVLRCAPRDAGAVRALAAARAATTVTPDDGIAAGVRTEMADGSLVVDATAETRLARMRGALAIELAAAVEGAP